MNKMLHRVKPRLLKKSWLLLSFFSAVAIAQGNLSPENKSLENKGLEIVAEMDKRNTGWEDFTARMEMVLKNKRGDSSVRELNIKTLEVSDDGDKSLTLFEKPRDVEGTAFLSFSHAVEPDQQWLYLPALKRVKRIASANKSGPFMGSEFAFEDISSFEIDKYEYQYIKDETVNGQDCYLVRYTPRYEHSGYSHQHVWIDKAEYRVKKIDFYDRKQSLLKTLTNSDYQLYLDEFWRPSKITMINHQSEKSTELTWHNYQFKTGLQDSEFNSNTLRRAR